MEYVQMTLNDWVEMKRKLRQELLGVKQSFVRIGYALRKIEDQKLYENDGYKSIAEFAKEEYGLEPSTTSRFMGINREYSIDGYSEQLRPEYAAVASPCASFSPSIACNVAASGCTCSRVAIASFKSESIIPYASCWD